jgi:cation diffusion facilitator family transporter
LHDEAPFIHRRCSGAPHWAALVCLAPRRPSGGDVLRYSVSRTPPLVARSASSLLGQASPGSARRLLTHHTPPVPATSHDDLAAWRCSRDFGESSLARERSTRWVVALTFGMMVVEIAVGAWTGSMALLADGWHMGTHAGALGLAAVAYWFARTRAEHRSFSFGTGKVHALAGYSSALVLGMVAFSMVLESVERLIHPTPIRYREALGVAILGLIVNLVSFKLLGHGQAAGRAHGHDHDHDGDGHDHDKPSPGPRAHHATDHNYRAAIMHVAADALTSVLAIIALSLGVWRGWQHLDPLMGIVGAAIVLKWGVGLCISAGRQLLDATSSEALEQGVKTLLEAIDDLRVADIHTWEVGPGRLACIVSLVTESPRDTAYYREIVLGHYPLAHLSIEVHRAVRNP